MRIGILYTSALDDFASPLANSLQNKAEIIVVTNRDANKVAENVRTMRVPHFGRRMLNPLYVFEALLVAMHLRRLHVDIIHLEFFYPFLSYFLLAFRNTPIVLTLHEIEPRPRLGGAYGKIAILLLWYVFFLAPVMIHRSARLIVSGNSMRERLTRIAGVPVGKVDVIPLAIYQQPFAENHEEERTILFFGNMWWSRGLDMLLQSLLPLREELRGTRIIIAGGGKLPREWIRLINICRKYFEIELHNHYVPDREVDRLFQRSTVVALPYRSASSSGALLTSLAHGKPVVAFRVGYLSEAIEDGMTGLLARPGNITEFGDKIRLLLENKGLRDRMAKRIEVVRANLAPDKIAEMHLLVYKQALTHPPNRLH